MSAARWLVALSALLLSAQSNAQPAPAPPGATLDADAPAAGSVVVSADDEGLVDLTGAAPVVPPPQPPAQPSAPSGPSQPTPYVAWPPPGGTAYPTTPPAGLPPPPPVAADEPPHRGQRYVGFGPRIGTFWGFGAGARAGHPYVGTDISGGWKPVLATLDPPENHPGYPDSDPELHGYHAWQLNGHVYVMFNPGSSFVAGLTAGYRYNSLLRHGMALAFDGVIELSDHFGLHMNVGPVLFPDGDERLREAEDIPDEVEFTFPGPGGNLALSLGLMIYP